MILRAKLRKQVQSTMRKLVFQLLRKSENTLFGKYLLLTNTVSSGLLMFVGEVAAQKIDKSNKPPDWEKVKQLTVVGISQGPLHHYTYLWMERLLPGTTKSAVFKKILSDQVFRNLLFLFPTKKFCFQLIVSPIFIVHYFYTAFFLAGKSTHETNELVKKTFLTVYLADWIVWPPTQFINFFFVPLR